jgi:hypothetical protein
MPRALDPSVHFPALEPAGALWALEVPPGHPNRTDRSLVQAPSNAAHSWLGDDIAS